MTIVRRRNKHEPACRGERTSHIHCSRPFYALRLQLFNDAERHSPRVLAGVDVDRHHLAPRWFLARPIVLGIPEAREAVADPRGDIVSSRLDHLRYIGQVEYVEKEISERRIVRTAVPIGRAKRP